MKECGQCPGSIYIDLIHIVSAKVCSHDALRDFCDNLDDFLYLGKGKEFYVYVNEEEICIHSYLDMTEIPDAEIYRVSGYYDSEHSQYFYDQYEKVEHCFKR